MKKDLIQIILILEVPKPFLKFLFKFINHKKCILRKILCCILEPAVWWKIKWAMWRGSDWTVKDNFLGYFINDNPLRV